MNIDIISVGKLKEEYLKSGINEFLKRMGPYAKVKVIEIPDEKAPENLSDADLERIKIIEGEKILAKTKALPALKPRWLSCAYRPQAAQPTVRVMQKILPR